MLQKTKQLCKIFKFLKILILTIFSGIITYFFFAFLFSLLPTHPPKKNCFPEKEIFITTNGVHVDIILPVNNLKPNFLQHLDILPGTKYISFGWGDKAFYIHTPEWSDLKFHIAFKALFLKSESAMHVTCYPRSLSQWKKITLCRQQLQILNQFIENSFKKTGSGSFSKLSFPGYTYYDNFYKANGSFSLFQTCNVWANNALKKIGIKTSVWSPFDFGILYHIP